MKKLLIIICAFFIGILGYFYKKTCIEGIVSENFRINIRKGDNLLNKIEESPYLKSKKILKKLISIRGKKILPGSYFIPSGASVCRVLDIILRGKQKPISFTFSGADSLEDFIDQVTKKLNISAEALEKLFRDDFFLEDLGFTRDNILVMFIPNTYEIYWNISAKDFLVKMHSEYQKFWNQKGRKKIAAEHKLSLVDISILASIVQSETNKIDEASRIAGVYLNRLRKKIPLGSDPNIKKHLKNSGIRRILRSHLQLNFHDNTYKRIGIPRSPICIPKEKYIDAVLNAEKHCFFYFCAKDDFSGYHVFSRNFQEHIDNSAKYKRKLNRMNIFK